MYCRMYDLATLSAIRSSAVGPFMAHSSLVRLLHIARRGKSDVPHLAGGRDAGCH
jgi:hypothetical protein